MVTPFDIQSAQFLNPLVPAFKIASGDNNFYPLIEAVASLNKPILLSGGIATLAELQYTVDFIRRIWNKNRTPQDLAVLHCVASYPTEKNEANLKAIESLKKLNVTVGYSDHTIGIDAAILSVALGARVIEKHFTIDKNYSDFRDHKIAADPKDLAELVKRVREAEIMLGDGVKRAMPSEELNREKVRRSIAVRRDMKAGETLQVADLIWVRPGNGLAPGEESSVVGRPLAKPAKKGQILTMNDLAEFESSKNG